MEANGVEVSEKLATIPELVEESKLPINNIEVKERRKSSCHKGDSMDIEGMRISDPIPEEEYK